MYATAAPGRSPNHFISSLTDEDFAAIAGDLQQIELKRDDLIVRAGSDLSAAYLPLTCILSVIVVMQDGGHVESRTIGREGGHGLLHALGGPRSHEQMVCQVAGRCLKIALPVLRSAAEQRPGLMRAIATHAEATYIQLAQSAACNVLHPANARLARWLLMTRERVGNDVLPLTQEHLATMLGVQRTTVTAVAQVLQEKGLIAYRRGKITIQDGEGLKRESCECYVAVRNSVAHAFADQAGAGA